MNWKRPFYVFFGALAYEVLCAACSSLLWKRKDKQK